MVPVVVRETEHLHRAYCLAAVAVKRATEALPSALRLSLAPQAVPPASTPIEFASPCAPPALSPSLTLCPMSAPAILLCTPSSGAKRPLADSWATMKQPLSYIPLGQPRGQRSSRSPKAI